MKLITFEEGRFDDDRIEFDRSKKKFALNRDVFHYAFA